MDININIIPDEIILRILSCLTEDRDLLTSSQVCKLWNILSREQEVKSFFVRKFQTNVLVVEAAIFKTIQNVSYG